MPRIFLVLLTGPTGSMVTFLAGHVSKRLFSLTIESFSCDLREMEKEKRSVCVFFPLPFNPNYLWSNYPARVYAFFSCTLWPCCGCSEVWTHYRSCLPPKHTIKTPPATPLLQDCRQSQMWSHKLLSWYAHSKVELCHKYACISLTICTHSFKHLWKQINL